MPCNHESWERDAEDCPCCLRASLDRLRQSHEYWQTAAINWERGAHRREIEIARLLTLLRDIDDDTEGGQQSMSDPIRRRLDAIREERGQAVETKSKVS